MRTSTMELKTCHVYTKHLKKAPDIIPETRKILDDQDGEVRQRMICEWRNNKLTRDEILKLKYPKAINICDVILPE